MDDLESAFPLQYKTGYGVLEKNYGLTKREWFAGLALQGLLANAEIRKTRSDGSWKFTTLLPKHAFEYADKMIEESKE